MIYGKTYSFSAPCYHCDSRTSTTRDECHKCGEPRCSDCAQAVEDTDAPTGYHGVLLICSNCASEPAEAIACILCGSTESDVQEFRAELPSAVCCGRPGILVGSERRVIDSREVA